MQALAVALILVLAPNDGHVFGGQAVELQLQRAVDVAGPWVIDWQLAYGGLVLATDRLELEGADATLTLELPAVRARTPMTWSYHVVSMEDPKRELGRGEQVIRVYPPLALADAAAPFVGRRVVLVANEPDQPLALRLTEAGLTVETVTPKAYDPIRRVDLLVIGQDALTERLGRHLRQIAAHGAAIIVLRQSEPNDHSPLPMNRHVSMSGDWRLSHPLLAGMDAAMLDAWARSDQPVAVYRLDGADSATGLGGWRSPAASERPAKPGAAPPPIREALIATQAVEPGAIVCWQLPVEDWSTDPRAHLMLYNTLLSLAVP